MNPFSREDILLPARSFRDPSENIFTGENPV